MLPRSGKEGIKDRQRDHKALLSPPPDAANTSPFAATAGHGGAAVREELHEGATSRVAAPRSTRPIRPMGVRSTRDDAFSGHLCQKTTGLAILASGALCRAHTRPGKMLARLRTAPFSWRWRLPNRPVFDSWERFRRQRKGRGGANKPGASGRAQASPGARGRGGAGRLQSARGKRRQAPPPRRPGQSPRPFGTWIAGATRSARRLPPAGARCRCPGGTWPRRRRRRRTSRQGRARPATSTGPWRSRGSRS